MWNKLKTWYEKCDGQRLIWRGYTLFSIVFFIWGFNFIHSMAA